MKTLHITASYKPAYIYGGPIASVSVLCECLTRVQSRKLKAESEKLDLEVFTTNANGKSELDVETGKPIIMDNVPVTYFKRWTRDHSHFSPALLLHLNKVLRQAQHDNDNLLIHIHAWWNLVSVLSCLVAKWHKVPVVLSPRGMLTSYTQSNRNSFSKKIIHWVIGHNLLKSVHIHATSEQEKLEALKILKPKSISVIPNLVSLPGSENRVSGKEYEVDRGIFNLIFLSRIEEKKGLELLFDALSALKIDYRLTVAGSGNEDYVESLKRKAESLKLSERIEWLGQISKQDKFELLAKHDLLVLTSYNENFANVVIESLSVGTPVLVSKHVGLADYVKNNDLGWVCSLEPEDIANKIRVVCEDTLKRETIRRNAPTLISNNFNDEVLVGRYLELYDNVLQLHSK